ncbi:MAG: sugar phosphate isomerase/epimerase [Bacteroidetes bacterium]|jgi:sugar phosphate isomerase/epimerase|nr:sugar phosphate isomerase/epimerase [Bacteroidota bacterium]
MQTRRKFIRHTSKAALGLGLFGMYACGNTTTTESTEEDQSSTETKKPMEAFFKVSLAQWSLHRALQSGEMDNLDFAAAARNDYDIGAIEYVNQFFKDKAKDAAYLAEMNKRAADNGVKNLLIMIDSEGGLAETDDAQRKKAVENHYKWVEAAKTLGCHSIRVNAYSSNPDIGEAGKAAIDGLGSLATFAKDFDINVIVENHGGFSSDGKWLSGIMARINIPNCGTLPDFGNFCVRNENGKCADEYDRYMGVTELMPFAKAVSAKSHDFDANGNETNTDYLKMMQIVKAAGYNGYVGIEYEGSVLSEKEGIMATKALLDRVGEELKG